jgi:hypothetical protein
MSSRPQADVGHVCEASPAGDGPPGAALVAFLAFLGLALRILPLRLVVALASCAAWAPRPRPRASARCLVARVDRACRRAWPVPTCLVRSLALDALLRRHGHESQVVIGVAAADGRLSAHAWVETADGRAVEPDGQERYRVLCRIAAGGIHPVGAPEGVPP